MLSKCLWQRKMEFRHILFGCLQRLSSVNRYVSRRFMTTKEPHQSSQHPGKMKGWQIHEYGGIELLQCNEHIKIPIINSPNDVLVEVKAASVNPIDVAMMGGYGATLLNVLRCNSNIEFPLTLGRDFSGIVTRKGMSVREEIQVGDKVWGVVPIHRSGCHAEFVLVDEYCISPQPEKTSSIDAAGILYAGLTAWSSLFVTGQLGGVAGALTSQGGGRGKRVCILGASGGVGSIALQICRAENVETIATCSTDAFQLVKNLGADFVVDYTEPESVDQLCELGPYDIILDCAGKGVDYATQVPWKFDQFITLSSPLLRNFDAHGMGIGLFKNMFSLLDSNVQSVTKHRGLTKWGFFVPAPQGIEYLQKLRNRKKLSPVIDRVYDFNETNDAYQQVIDGHLRGKVVLNLRYDKQTT